jgi:PKD repeat protein
MNTTVPSCDESCQPSLHGEHQLTLTSNYCCNTINSKESTEYVSDISKGDEVSVMKSDEDTIKTSTEESFKTLKNSETLPSSGSMDGSDKSYNNSYSQTPAGSKAPFLAEIKSNPLKKSGVNEECLDGMRIKMENISG